MNSTTATAIPTENFVLAGRNDDGVWHEIERAALEEGDTVDQVKTFLQTLALANNRNYADLEILTETEFVRRNGSARRIAA